MEMLEMVLSKEIVQFPPRCAKPMGHAQVHCAYYSFIEIFSERDDVIVVK